MINTRQEGPWLEWQGMSLWNYSDVRDVIFASSDRQALHDFIEFCREKQVDIPRLCNTSLDADEHRIKDQLTGISATYGHLSPPERLRLSLALTLWGTPRDRKGQMSVEEWREWQVRTYERGGGFDE